MTIGDLTPKLLDLFVSQAVGNGHTLDTYGRYRHILTRIAAHAALRRGDPQGDPHEILERSLRWYFDRYFLPEWLTDKSCHTRWRYQTSIAMFDKFMGRCLVLAEITEERLTSFWEHTLRRGAKESTARKYVKQIRTIVEHAARRAMNAEGDAA